MVILMTALITFDSKRHMSLECLANLFLEVCSPCVAGHPLLSRRVVPGCVYPTFTFALRKTSESPNTCFFPLIKFKAVFCA